ncbi:hypothetical protein [Roseicyclus sp.]|uniref:hypothetical protein n=1 Tax=Roseicyclus sp. TaxID=1914329 RepID=UPI003F6D356E
MTEAAKSAEEIEDVLASIRRLVAGPGAKPAAPPPSDGPEKLVLTPALRVSEPDDPWAPVGRPADDDTHDATDPQTDETAWGLEDRLADWGEIADSAQEAVSDAIAEGLSADEPWPAHDRQSFRAKLTHLQNAASGAEFEAETGDANWPDAGADQALRELVHMRGQSQPEAPSPEDTLEQGEAPDAAGPDDLGHAAYTDADGDAEAPLDDSTDEATSQTAAHAPDADLPDEDEATADAVDDLMHDDDENVEDLGDTTAPFSFPEAEDGILDEETLREIVSEVVRQELQGALGQRITRNVRKMVRREIRLALAAEELE